MKTKGSGLICVVTVAVVLLSASNSMAQHSGFQIAIAPPNAPAGFGPAFGPQPFVVLPGNPGFGPYGFPPTQTPMVVRQRQLPPGSQFAFNPYGSFAYPSLPQVAIPNQILMVAPGQIITSGQVFVGGIPATVAAPGQVFIPTQVLVPGQVFLPGVVIQQVPPARFVSLGPPIAGVTPPVGTRRADVLRQFGQPTVSVITRDGETLHFSGGVTVFIQNDQVASPK